MFVYNRTINFHQADPAGVLFFGNIFPLAHDAYEAFITGLGTERNYFNDNDYAIPILHAEADYYSVIQPGDKLTISIKATTVKSSSFELAYVFTDDEKNIKAKVKTIHVLVRKKDFRKTELTDELLVGLNSILD
jgi:1,4-dihydroxy-2-naphthoyl-CoA hydrolase